MRGGKHLIDRLEKLKKAINEDVPKAIDTIVDERRQAVEQGFATAQYEGDNDVSVGVNKPDKNIWRLTAEGTSVLFIEYGSGIVMKHDSGFGNASAYPPRSWSLGPNGKGWLSDENIKLHRGGWPYGGHYIYGNPSNNVMFEASKQLRYDARNGKVMRPIKGAMK